VERPSSDGLPVNKEDESVNRECRRGGAPRRLYHTSPFEMKIGTNTRPRWSSFTGHWRVWMTSSLRGATDTARQLVSDLREGAYGYCATGPAHDLKPQTVHGAWIYRVKPTGRMERCEAGRSWFTSFPVRVVEFARTYGEPWRNALSLTGFVTTERAAEELMMWLSDVQRDVSEDVRRMCGQDHVSWPTWWSVEERELAQLLLAYEHMPLLDKQREVRHWLKRKYAEEAVRLAHRQRKEHRKRLPRPRYKRDRSWQRMAAEELL